MGLDQTGCAVADQQRLEDAVAAYRGEVVGVQQRGLGRMYSPSSVTITPVWLAMDAKPSHRLGHCPHSGSGKCLAAHSPTVRRVEA